MPSIRLTLLEHVNNPNYQPVKPAVIAKQLGLASEAARELKNTIKQLIKSGELAWGPSHLVYSTQKKHAPRHNGETPPVGGHDHREKTKRKLEPGPSGESKHFTGTCRRAAGGFGFVRPAVKLRAEGRDA